MVEKGLINVILLGFAFMLVFTAFQTWGNVQKTMIHSIMEEDENYHGNAYYSLAIIYVVFSLFNWSVPSVISVCGPKMAMIAGATTYLLFILSFTFPLTSALYLASIVLGIGAALIWTGQGNYLALNSTSKTIQRNAGLFWALLQLSLFIGNLFVFYTFRGKDTVDKESRILVTWTLSAIALSGIILMMFLGKPPHRETSIIEEFEKPTPWHVFKDAVELFFTRDMLVLNMTFFYTGLELGFWSGVYSSCISFTEKLPSRKQLVGLSGIFMGAGEVLGGLIFGLLGHKTVKWGGSPIVILGFACHITSFVVIFLNLPNDSPFAETSQSAIIESNAVLAIMCSFLLGFGDACYNTQVFSILGGVYADESASAFAIFKFMQSFAAACSFFYASYLVLYGQLAILVITSILGTATFVWVEWKAQTQSS